MFKILKIIIQNITVSYHHTQNAQSNNARVSIHTQSSFREAIIEKWRRGKGTGSKSTDIEDVFRPHEMLVDIIRNTLFTISTNKEQIMQVISGYNLIYALHIHIENYFSYRVSAETNPAGKKTK